MSDPPDTIEMNNASEEEYHEEMDKKELEDIDKFEEKVDTKEVEPNVIQKKPDFVNKESEAMTFITNNPDVNLFIAGGPGTHKTRFCLEWACKMALCDRKVMIIVPREGYQAYLREYREFQSRADFPRELRANGKIITADDVSRATDSLGWKEGKLVIGQPLFPRSSILIGKGGDPEFHKYVESDDFKEDAYVLESLHVLRSFEFKSRCQKKKQIVATFDKEGIMRNWNSFCWIRDKMEPVVGARNYKLRLDRTSRCKDVIKFSRKYCYNGHYASEDSSGPVDFNLQDTSTASRKERQMEYCSYETMAGKKAGFFNSYEEKMAKRIVLQLLANGVQADDIGVGAVSDLQVLNLDTALEDTGVKVDSLINWQFDRRSHFVFTLTVTDKRRLFDQFGKQHINILLTRPTKCLHFIGDMSMMKDSKIEKYRRLHTWMLTYVEDTKTRGEQMDLEKMQMEFDEFDPFAQYASRSDEH